MVFLYHFNYAHITHFLWLKQRNPYSCPPKLFHRKYVAKKRLPVQILRLYKVVESQIHRELKFWGGFITNSKIKTDRGG